VPTVATVPTHYPFYRRFPEDETAGSDLSVAFLVSGAEPVPVASFPIHFSGKEKSINRQRYLKNLIFWQTGS